MNGLTAHLDPERHARILAERILPESGLRTANSYERPKAILLGGQPGSGKGGLVKSAKAEFFYDVVPIDPDELRNFHPDLKEFQRTHPYTWSGDTHPDASQWADELLEASVAGKKC